MRLEAVTMIRGAPSPTPIEIVIENPASGTGFTDWIPLFAALLTLFGVVLVSHRAGKSLINTENLRHDNDLHRAARDHMLDTVRDTYTALEAGRRELLELAFRFEPVDDPGLEVYLFMIEPQREAWESARAKYSRALDSVTLVGSDNVSRLAQQVHTSAFMLDVSIRVANREVEISTEDGGIPVDGSIESIRQKAGTLRASCIRLLKGMRAELHPQGPTPSSAS